MKFFRKIIVFLLLVSCGATEDEKQPGMCALDCSSPTILGDVDKFEIQRLAGEQELKVICNAGTSFVVTERFVVKSKADAKGQSGVIASAAINVMNKLSSYANPDVNPVDKNRPEYNGILTPTKEWCTDSCGVFKLQLSLICPGTDSEGDFIISSGPVGFTYKFSFENPDDTNLSLHSNSFSEKNSLWEARPVYDFQVDEK